MPVADMVARSGDLKRELVAYAKQPQFAKDFRRALAGAGGDDLDKGKFITVLDFFILQHRLPDGRRVVEHFVEDRPELAEVDRELLLGWRDVVEGLFEVQRRDGEALVVFNVVDELAYRVRSNAGTAVFTGMPPGSFLVARLVPVGDEWLLSGSQAVLPASARPQVARMAAEYSDARPALVFRNPEKLERGWELQREDRVLFVEFFGSDLVVETGARFVKRIHAYEEFRARRIAERTGRRGELPPVPHTTFPPALTEAATVGMIYGEVEGLTYLARFGLFAEAFDEPGRVRRQPHREVVRSYLRDRSVSPLPFRRLAAADPAKASRVFQLLLRRPGFSWESDGEVLLRQHKAAFFDTPRLPRFTPVSEIVVEYYQATSPRPR